MEKYAELREAVEKVELVDAHAHNIVALDSAFPFIGCFSEANGDALSYATHSLCFKVTPTTNPSFRLLLLSPSIYTFFLSF